MCAIKKHDKVIHMLPTDFIQSLCIVGLILLHTIWRNSQNNDLACVTGFSISVVKAAFRAMLKLQQKTFPHHKSLWCLVCTISIKRLAYL